MADFPAKVATETSSPQPRRGGFPSINLNMDFFRTIPAVLMVAEILLGLLVWVLITSTHYWKVHAFGWVMFVSITLWILTIILFCMLLSGVQHKLTSVPWPLVVMVFNAAATLLYLTAFIANAASTDYFYVYHRNDFSNMIAAAFFGIVVTLVYGASTVFSYMTWRGDGGNAAGNTVPA